MAFAASFLSVSLDLFPFLCSHFSSRTYPKHSSASYVLFMSLPLLPPYCNPGRPLHRTFDRRTSYLLSSASRTPNRAIYLVNPETFPSASKSFSLAHSSRFPTRPLVLIILGCPRVTFSLPYSCVSPHLWSA